MDKKISCERILSLIITLTSYNKNGLLIEDKQVNKTISKLYELPDIYKNIDDIKELNQSAYQLLDVFLVNLGNRIISYSKKKFGGSVEMVDIRLTKYMSDRGIIDENEAIEKAEKDLDTLYLFSFKEEFLKQKNFDELFLRKVRLISAAGIVESMEGEKSIWVEFSQDFYRMFSFL